MSLLAHIVSHLKDRDLEPTATKSLAYILRSSPDLAASLTDLLCPSVGFEFGHVESERRFEDGRPDLTIFDSKSRRRIFIENKFWAGLTAAQPVQYLAALPEDLPSGLVFIVPEQRIPSVWDELKRRSRDAYEFGNESPPNNTMRLELGSRTLCVTSWRHVLAILEQSAPSDDLRRDVLQLGGLAKLGELDGFPPLRAQELSDVSIPKRMIDYLDLVEDIVAELKTRGIAGTEGLQPSRTWYDTGRYLKVFEKFEVWLGVALEPWKKTGITPIWLRVDSPGKKFKDYSNLGERYDHLEESFIGVQAGNYEKYIPIRLRTSIEPDELIRDAADQVNSIAEKFREITGSPTRATKTG